MKSKAIGVLAMFLVPLACGNADDLTVPTTTQAVTTTAGEVFKIGVLMDNAAFGKADFVAAVNMAMSDLNKGLHDAGATQSFQILVRNYTTNPDFTTDVKAQAIDLVNNEGVWGLVVDENFATADVTDLNYEPDPRLINKNVAVTCFQCGTSKIHGPGEFYAGFADPFFWMSRTFFNDHFEAPAHARIVHGRIGGGDVNGDGYVKVVTYYDPEHERPGVFFQEYLDALTPGPHSTNAVERSGIFSFDMQLIFDPGPDGHAPDVVVMMMGHRDGLPALQAYKNYSAPNKPPLQLSEALRRDALLPTLIGTGLPGIEGVSVQRVNGAPSGTMFKNAFKQATGHEPELTASYAYDAVVMLAGAIGWAFHFELLGVLPDAVAAYIPSVSDPTGATIRPRASDFKTAALRINNDQPINYDGASSSMDLDFNRDNNPDLVHWKIDKGKFVELESYGCDPEHDSCFKR